MKVGKYEVHLLCPSRFKDSIPSPSKLIFFHLAFPCCITNLTMPLEVLVFVSPKPGKEKRGEEILTTATEKIRSEEPYTLNYHWYKYQSEEENCVDYIVYAR